ncbi:hypothetical protein [Rubidibacter lacunae]|uniref:hypothetical protein n=1 Tax=Rubidibacter lacunae TaxID=582514 RepID=UPI0003FB8AB7|nr:hypothetical protein [Rubidibacter lacunae]
MTLPILHVDKGRLHTAMIQVLPENVMLLFQPPFYPELNPTSKCEKHLQRDRHWEVFEGFE